MNEYDYIYIYIYNGESMEYNYPMFRQSQFVLRKVAIHNHTESGTLWNVKKCRGHPENESNRNGLGGFRSQDAMAAMGAGAMVANEDLEIETWTFKKGQ